MLLTNEEKAIALEMQNYKNRPLGELFDKFHKTTAFKAKTEFNIDGVHFSEGQQIIGYEKPQECLRFLEILGELIDKLNHEHLTQTYRNEASYIPKLAWYENGNVLARHDALGKKLDNIARLELYITDGFKAFIDSGFLTEVERAQKRERESTEKQFALQKDAGKSNAMLAWAALIISSAIGVTNIITSSKDRIVTIAKFQSIDTVFVKNESHKIDSINSQFRQIKTKLDSISNLKSQQHQISKNKSKTK